MVIGEMYEILSYFISHFVVFSIVINKCHIVINKSFIFNTCLYMYFLHLLAVIYVKKIHKYKQNIDK